MGLGYAIEQLYASGWTGEAHEGCRLSPEGRLYPGLDRIRAEFQRAGFEFSIREIPLFDCSRAEWRDAEGRAAGAVVGHTPDEAGVYALSQMRRSLADVAIE